MLAAVMWHEAKKTMADEHSLMRKKQAQNLLRDIDKAHVLFYENKNSKEQFNTWLLNHQLGTTDDAKRATEAAKTTTTTQPDNSIKAATLSKRKSKSFRNIATVDAITIEPKTPAAAAAAPTTIATDSDAAFAAPSSSILSPSAKLKGQMKSVRLALGGFGDGATGATGANSSPKSQRRLMMASKTTWNISTKVPGKDYVNNLKDFYPRDQYTMMPKDVDLVLLNKELKGMSLEQIREFMNKNLSPATAAAEILTTAAASNEASSSRPVYYKPKWVLDIEPKAKIPLDERLVDEAAFAFSNDTRSLVYKQAANFVLKSKKRAAAATQKLQSLYQPIPTE